jgi:hypothetical protein
LKHRKSKKKSARRTSPPLRSDFFRHLCQGPARIAAQGFFASRKRIKAFCHLGRTVRLRYSNAMTLRPILGLLLALLLAVTSVTMAVARGQSPMGRDVIICAGAGTSTITLDANGNPVRAMHPCPDCLMGVTAAIAPDAVAAHMRPHTRGTILAHTQTALAATLRARAATARGPPAIV